MRARLTASVARAAIEGRFVGNDYYSVASLPNNNVASRANVVERASDCAGVYRSRRRREAVVGGGVRSCIVDGAGKDDHHNKLAL